MEIKKLFKNKKCKCGKQATAIKDKEYLCQNCYEKKKVRKNGMSKSWLDKYIKKTKNG